MTAPFPIPESDDHFFSQHEGEWQFFLVDDYYPILDRKDDDINILASCRAECVWLEMAAEQWKIYSETSIMSAHLDADSKHGWYLSNADACRKWREQ